MNSDIIALVVSFFVGALLGALYFGGLWLTVKRLSEMQRPWLWFLSSAMLRTGLALLGFWAVGVAISESGRWQRLMVCLVGFMAARFVITRGVKHGLDQTTQDRAALRFQTRQAVDAPRGHSRAREQHHDARVLMPQETSR